MSILCPCMPLWCILCGSLMHISVSCLDLCSWPCCLPWHSPFLRNLPSKTVFHTRHKFLVNPKPISCSTWQQNMISFSSANMSVLLAFLILPCSFYMIMHKCGQIDLKAYILWSGHGTCTQGKNSIQFQQETTKDSTSTSTIYTKSIQHSPFTSIPATRTDIGLMTCSGTNTDSSALNYGTTCTTRTLFVYITRLNSHLKAA